MTTQWLFLQSHNSIGLVVSDKMIFKVSTNRNTLLALAAMLNFRSTPKTGRGQSNEHLWQVWLKSVQRFQRRRVKCEKLTDGRRTLTHDKSSHGLWPGELKMNSLFLSWSKRNILLLGKALMVKSLIIHILTFVVSSCVIPEKYKKR